MPDSPTTAMEASQAPSGESSAAIGSPGGASASTIVSPDSPSRTVMHLVVGGSGYARNMAGSGDGTGVGSMLAIGVSDGSRVQAGGDRWLGRRKGRDDRRARGGDGDGGARRGLADGSLVRRVVEERDSEEGARDDGQATAHAREHDDRAAPPRQRGEGSGLDPGANARRQVSRRRHVTHAGHDAALVGEGGERGAALGAGVEVAVEPLALLARQVAVAQ